MLHPFGMASSIDQNPVIDLITVYWNNCYLIIQGNNININVISNFLLLLTFLKTII